MARPKPAIPVDIPFHTRVTRGENRAIEELIESWAEMNRKHGRIVDRSKTTWFRSLIHTLASQAGITITEPSPGDEGLPVKADKPADT